MNAYRVGFFYELRAAGFVRGRGMRLLARRFRAADGEIDLIARDGQTIVFIEVKARPQGRLGEGVQAVSADKRRRLRNAARAYLRHMGQENAPCRYDVLEFTRAGIQYIENAF